MMRYLRVVWPDKGHRVGPQHDSRSVRGTLKLNAAAEMEPITWPEFSRQHPFAPHSDAPGLHKLIADLETWLRS
jgi:hypothetical protein